MAERLDGTVALVTGASSGIGEATARGLAGHGAAVAVLARRGDRLEDLRGAIEADGGRALVVEADVTDRAAATEAVDRVAEELGRLDTVVNNAGVMLLGPVQGAPLDEWDRMIEVNLRGLLHVAHAALPHLVRAVEDGPRGVADLVNISSVAGRRASSGAGVYNLTKFGVGAFSEALRQEVTKRSVRVSVIEPGAVSTELASHMRDEVQQAAMSRFEGIEFLHPEDISEAIEYLVTRPRRVAVNEIMVRPTDQDF